MHLEVVPNFTVHSFIQAYRRFVSRKSKHKTLIPNNASTYSAGSGELKRVCELSTLKDTLSIREIDRKFIPKRAPWYGGFLKSLILITRTSLKNTLGRSHVNIETLQTIVTEKKEF